jgi:hypothetical protein
LLAALRLLRLTEVSLAKTEVNGVNSVLLVSAAIPFRKPEIPKGLRSKFQIPSTKSETNPDIQIRNSKTFWTFEI